jgi:hypothetical protein
LRRQTIIANLPSFERGAEAVARAFGELPEEVGLTQASEEFVQRNLEAIRQPAQTPDDDPIKRIRTALDEGQIEVEEAFESRRQQKEAELDQGILGFFKSKAFTIGRTTIDLASSMAELAALGTQLPGQEIVLQRLADELGDLSETAATQTTTSREFQEEFQRRSEDLKEEREFGPLEAVGKASNLFGGRQTGAIMDSFLRQIQSFSGAATQDPIGAFEFGTDVVAQAIPSLAFMMATGSLGQAANMAKPAAFIAGAALESGAQVQEVTHNPKSGERIVPEPDDLAIALVSGTAAGVVEGLSALNVLGGLQKATRASSSFKALTLNQRKSFWRNVGQRLKDAPVDAFTEGGTEVIQGIITDAGASVGWDPAREIGQDALLNFIGGFGAAGGMRAIALPGTVSRALRESKEARIEEEIQQRVPEFAGVSSELLLSAHANAASDSNIPLPVSGLTSDAYAAEINRRAIYLTPSLILESTPEDLLNEYEARAIPGEQNILFITNEQGVPVHVYTGRDNIAQLFSDVHSQGKQAAFQEEGQQTPEAIEEARPAGIEAVPITEEAEEVTAEEAEAGVIEDRVRAAVIMVPDAEGNMISVEGINQT